MSIDFATLARRTRCVAGFILIGTAALACAFILSLFHAPAAQAFDDPASGLTYRDDGDTVSVTGCIETCPSDLRIPATIDGRPVISILNYAFNGSSNAAGVTTVTIESGVETIGEGAFVLLGALRSVTLPDTIERIELWAFAGSTTLTNITIPNSVAHIGTYAFSSSPELTTVRFQGNAPEFADDAFFGSPDAVFYVRTGTSGWDELQNPPTAHAVVAVDPPTILNQPTATTGTVGEPAQLSVSAASDASAAELQYQWKKDGEAIEGQTSATLSLPSPTEADAGEYTVDVTSWAGAVTSEPATLTINPSPFTYSVGEVAVTITGCADPVDGCPPELAIPDMLEGKPVTAISSAAFAHSGANTTSVAIGANVQSVGLLAFGRMGQLTEFNVAPENASFTAIDGVLLNKSETKIVQYPVGRSATSYVIPETVTTIGAAAFYGAASLTSLAIPDNVTSTELAAFAELERVEGISIGRGLISIGVSTFASNGATAFTVSDENPSYTAIGGALYSKNGQTLEQYPLQHAATDFAVPNAVTAIAPHAVAKASNLRTVTLPASLQSIGRESFFASLHLEEIRFQGNSPTFEVNAFGELSGAALILHPADASGWGLEVDGVRVCAVLPPSISAGPEDAQILAGEPISLSVVGLNGEREFDGIPIGIQSKGGPLESLADSNDDLSYQWRRDGTPIDGAVTDTLSIPTATTNDSGVYTVEVSAWYGSITSDPATVTVTQPQTFTYQQVTTAGSASITITGCIADCPAALDIPETINDLPVTAISAHAFDGSATPTSVSIPASVVEIGRGAFADIGASSITVAEANPAFSSVDGVLFDSTGALLVQYPRGRQVDDYLIPESVATIGAEAFVGVSLGDFTIPSNVAAIGESAFTDATFTSLRMLGDAPSIAAGAFTSTGSSPFYYRQTAQGWTSVISPLDGHPLVAVAAPTLLTQPSAQTTPVGNSTTLTATGSGGDGGATITYQWYREDQAMDGATSDTLTIASTTASDAGVYHVQVTNWAGTTASSAAQVSVSGIEDPTSGLVYTDRGSTLTATGCIGGNNNCPSELTVPDTANSDGQNKLVTQIASHAFFETGRITDVAVGDNVAVIEDFAFAANPTLRSLHLGAKVAELRTAVFIGNQLADVTVAPGNDSFAADNDVLFSADNKTLYVFPGGNESTDYTVPQSVETVWSGAFFGVTSLHRLTIGSNVATIKYAAFQASSISSDVRFLGDAPTFEVDALSSSGSAPYYFKSGAQGWTDLPNPFNGHSLTSVSDPVIRSQPQNVTATEGSDVTLTVLADGGAGGAELTYQWRKGDDVMPGGVSPTLTLANTELTDAGRYSVVVSNWAGTVTSEGAIVQLEPRVRTAAGLTYQRSESEVTIVGCDGACPQTLTIPATIDSLPVTTIAAGAFTNSTPIVNLSIGANVTDIGQDAFSGLSALTHVRLLGDAPHFGDGAFANSGTAPMEYRGTSAGTWPLVVSGHPLVARTGPVITTQPEDVSAPAGSSATIGVRIATSQWDVEYEWMFNGVVIRGETSPTLTWPRVQQSHAGIYRASVTDWSGTVTTRAATLAMAVNPPSPGIPSPTPVNPAPKPVTNQTVALRVPAKLKRGKRYALPKLTQQGVSVRWQLSSKTYCSIKGSTLRCTKPTGKKSFTLVATAAATSEFNAFSTRFTRKVK